MTDLLRCRVCGKVDCYTTEQKSTQIIAYCVCGAYIKAIPTAVPKLYVGKYKGIPISEIEDASYLEWALKTIKLSAHVRTAIQERIKSLQFTHK